VREKLWRFIHQQDPERGQHRGRTIAAVASALIVSALVWGAVVYFDVR
jgi:hypothetical protein